MKRVVVSLTILMLCALCPAQENYTINGQTYTLKTEVSGNISLLWNIIDNQFRYFAKQGQEIVELTNTRGDDNKYQEEYKAILKRLTLNTFSTNDLRLTLPDLKQYINNYNASVDPSYTIDDDAIKLGSRLSFFGGITNHPYTSNPDNTTVPQIGAEIEIFEASETPRHALYLNLTSAFKNDELEYQNTQFGLGYRFRFINNNDFNVFGNIVIANYSFIKRTISYTQDNVTREESSSENGFDAPFALGFGADLKVSENGYITFGWHEIVALFLDDQNNFSTNFTLGYKFNL